MTDIELDDALRTWTAPTPRTAAMRAALAAHLDRRPLTSRVGFRWAAAAALAACAIVAASDFTTAALGTFSAAWDVPLGQIHVWIEHRIDPPVSPLRSASYGGGGFAGQNAGGLYGGSYVHDGSQTFYAYAYNLQLLDKGQMSLSFAMIAPSHVQRMFQPFKMARNLQSPPSLPAPQTITLGQPVEITLTEAGGERLYDRITFSSAAPTRAPRQMTGAMRMEDPKVYINGNLAAEDPGFSASGPTLWIHVPGQGRYLIALDPQANPRFTLAGTVEGTMLRFTSNGDAFRLESSTPLAAGGSRPVFIYHQQSFEDSLDPDSPDARRIFTGSAGPATLQQ